MSVLSMDDISLHDTVLVTSPRPNDSLLTISTSPLSTAQTETFSSSRPLLLSTAPSFTKSHSNPHTETPPISNPIFLSTWPSTLNGVKTAAPRQTIMEAVSTLEHEAVQLRELVQRLNVEAAELRRENEELQMKLDQSKAETRDAVSRAIQLEDARRKIQLDAENLRKKLDSETTTSKELERRLNDVNTLHVRQMTSLKTEVARKEAELRGVTDERELIRVRLEKAEKRNFEDCDFELLHELKLIKIEQSATRQQNDKLVRTNDKLRAELRNLELLVADRENEVKNERVRHSLLVEQYNHLMMENAALKRRQNVQSAVNLNDNIGDISSSNREVMSSTLNQDYTNQNQEIVSFSHRAGPAKTNSFVAGAMSVTPVKTVAKTSHKFQRQRPISGHARASPRIAAINSRLSVSSVRLSATPVTGPLTGPVSREPDRRETSSSSSTTASTALRDFVKISPPNARNLVTCEISTISGSGRTHPASSNSSADNSNTSSLLSATQTLPTLTHHVNSWKP